MSCLALGIQLPWPSIYSLVPGGLSQGFLDAGFRVAASVDADKWAALTQRHNHGSRENPTQVIEDDIENVTAEQLLAACKRAGAPRPDVLMGGPPCQGFSRSTCATRHMEIPTTACFRISEARGPTAFRR